jgi:hypothetical protein
MSSWSRVATAYVAMAVVVTGGAVAAGSVGSAPEPVLTGLSLTHPKIHAIGAEGTGVPKRTRLKLTLDVPAMVRVRVKDVDPYGLSRAFNTDLAAGSSAISFNARIDHTLLPPGRYQVVVKAHNSSGSSPKHVLRLRIVGNGD